MNEVNIQYGGRSDIFKGADVSVTFWEGLYCKMRVVIHNAVTADC